MRILALLLLLSLASLPAVAGKGKGAGSYGGAQASGGSTASGGHSHGGGMRNRMDARKVPPLAGDRKVNLQDCTKPIDWSAGNIQCK